MTRLLTAAALVPLVLAVVWWAPLWLFAILVVLVALVGLREFYDLAQGQGLQPYRWLGIVVTAATVLAMAAPFAPPAAFVAPWLAAVLIAGLLAVLIRALAHPERMAASLGDAGATLLGVAYLGLLMGTTGAVRLWGSIWLIFLLATVWLGDTAAYYAGRRWGRRRLAPRVSPKKSWEGSVASLVAAFAVGWSFGHWLFSPGYIAGALGFGVLAALMNLAAQAGDLVESLFKRGAQVKDSGELLPGHGGMLDRIDAMLCAAPVLWYYLAYFRQRV